MSKNVKSKVSKNDSSDYKGPIELNIDSGENDMKTHNSNDIKTENKADPLGDKLLFDEVQPKKKKTVEEDAEDESTSESDDSHEDSFITLEDIPKDKQKVRSGNSEYIHLKIPKPNLFWIERIVYWIIIIVLLIMVFKAPFANLFSNNDILGTIGDDDLNSNNLTVPVPNNAQVTQNNTVNTSNTNANQPQSHNITSNTSVKNTTADKSCDAGTPSIEIMDVFMDDDNDKKVTSVKVKVTNLNNIDLEKYYFSLTWWNRDDLDEGLGLDLIQRLKPTGTSKFYAGTKTIAKCGGSLIYNLDDELASAFVTSRDITNTFKIILKNSAGKDIASDTYTLNKI